MAALDYLRAGDTLVVWKLDRLGRSVKNVLTICDDLHEGGVGVRILTGKLSGTYSPTGEGKFFFTMMAAFAELERDINRERTMAGLAAAKAQGNVGGRPTVMDADKLAAAKARRARGESPTEIAKALGVSRASVLSPPRRRERACGKLSASYADQQHPAFGGLAGCCCRMAAYRPPMRRPLPGWSIAHMVTASPSGKV